MEFAFSAFSNKKMYTGWNKMYCIIILITNPLTMWIWCVCVCVCFCLFVYVTRTGRHLRQPKRITCIPCAFLICIIHFENNYSWIAKRLKYHTIPEKLKEPANDILRYLKILSLLVRTSFERKSPYFLSNHYMMLAAECIGKKMRWILADLWDERSHRERANRYFFYFLSITISYPFIT